MDANERESGLRLGEWGERGVALHRRGSSEWGEKEVLNGGVPSALEPSFRFSFALRPEAAALSRSYPNAFGIHGDDGTGGEIPLVAGDHVVDGFSHLCGSKSCQTDDARVWEAF